MWAVLRRDLQTQLSNLPLWLTLAAAQLILAWLLFAQLEVYQQISAQLKNNHSPLGINDLLISPTLNSLALLLLLLAPIGTLFGLSNERASGRLQHLYSTPISTLHIVLGKWLGMALPGFLVIALGLVMLISLQSGMAVEHSRLFTAAVSLTLLNLGIAAVCLMFSTFTRHPASALAASYGLLMLLWLLDSLRSTDGHYWLALNPHLDPALRGWLSSNDISYFLILCIAPLLVSLIRLHSDRQPRAAQPWRLLLFSVLLSGCLYQLSLLSQQHPSTLYRAESQALPDTLLDSLNSLTDPIHITAFATQQPLLRGQIDKLIQPLKHHHSDVVVTFVDPEQHPEQARRLQIQNDGELLIETQGRSQRVSQLNMPAITQAFARIARHSEPWVVVLQGHAEATLNSSAPDGLKDFQQLLSKPGLQTLAFNPLQHDQIPRNTAAVVVAGAQQDYSENTLTLLNAYLARGGALLWLQEGNGASDSLFKLLDVALLPGLVVDAAAARAGQNNPSHIPLLNYPTTLFDRIPDQYAILSGTRAMVNGEHWQRSARLQSSSQSWNENSTIKGKIQRNPMQGEQNGPLDIGLALQKDQSRVIVVGDSDFIRNSQLGLAGNRQFVLGLLEWLSKSPVAAPHQAADADISWSQTTQAIYAAIYMLFVPLLLISSGWLIRRRRQRA